MPVNLSERLERNAVLCDQIRGFLQEDPWFVPALSNVSALVMEMFEDLNWAGFYLMRHGRLVVGPFQGKPACIHIAVGRGVCGTCVEKDETIVVPDVHAFPGHIACDSASRSEIVLPIHSGGRTVAVMDIDSPLPDRFSEADRQILEEAVRVLEAGIEWDLS